MDAIWGRLGKPWRTDSSSPIPVSPRSSLETIGGSMEAIDDTELVR